MVLQENTMIDQERGTGKKTRRFWLYVPFAVLIVLVAGWSIAWFILRDRAEKTLDERIAAEAGTGRVWDCSQRSIGGFPFRIEVTCATLSLTKGGVSLSFGRTQALVQVYNPGHAIATFVGPMRFDDGQIRVVGNWQSLEASVVGLDSGHVERVAIAAQNPTFTISGLPEAGDIAVSAANVETHIRSTPGTALEDRSYDIAIDATGTVLPLFDNWLADTTPGSVKARLTGTHLRLMGGRTLAEAAEQWRMDGGKIVISSFSITKGARRLDLAGEGVLDALHRPEATLTISAANLSDIVARLVSGNGSAPLEPLGPEASKAPLVPMPPVKFQGGKIYVGPFVVPKVRLPPVY